MTAEAQWDSARWRDASETPRYGSMQQHPQLSALQTPPPGPRDSPSQAWYGTSQDQAPAYSYDSRRPSQAFGAQQSHHALSDRPAQPGSYGSASQPPLHHRASYGTGRSDPAQATGAGEGRPGDASLSLQIPKSGSGTYIQQGQLWRRSAPRSDVTRLTSISKTYPTLLMDTPPLGPTLRSTVAATALGVTRRPRFPLSQPYPRRHIGRTSPTRSRSLQCLPACLARSVPN